MKLPVLLLTALLAAPPASHAAEPRDAIVRQIDKIVVANFHEPAVLAERGWADAVARADAELAAAKLPAQRTAVLQALLATLRTSHTDYLPRDDPRYWDVASIFERVLQSVPDRCPDKSKLPALPVEVDGIGVWWERHDGVWYVGGVLDGSPAQAAGFVVGDEVVAADGAPFDPVTAFKGQAGGEVGLSYRRAKVAAQVLDIVVPWRVQPVASYVEATRKSARIIEHGGKRVGYLRLWIGVGEGLDDAVREAIRDFNAKGIDGFVLDLRDGWGGVPPELVTIFDTRVPALVTRARDGSAHRFDRQVRAPSAVLINGGSRSGKEVLAHAIKQHKLATLVGEPTAGAMLGGTPYCLDDGALLYLAVGTTTVDGAVLEGKPVQPDVTVPFDSRFAWGKDPQLDAALDHVTRTAKAPAD